MSIDQYSAVPGNNDLTNYFKTGMRPSAVKTAGWDIMADLASYIVALPTAAGTANGLTVSNGRPFGSLVSGLLQVLNPASANTGPATFAPDGLTAAPISTNGAALAGGEMQAGVPILLKYDGTNWNLLNPAPLGRNLFVDPCCRVGQGDATVNINAAYRYGSVDLVKIAGTAVSAGKLTQDTSGTVASAATPYSCKASAVTATSGGKVFFRRCIESRDAVALNGKAALFSALCRHDTGSGINAFLTVNKANNQDDFSGGVTNLFTGATVTVSTGTDTAVTASHNFGVNDGSNGIEVILEMDCGVVTTKNFYCTDWQACIGTLAQRCGVPRFDDDFHAALRYFEKSYPYGVVAGTTGQEVGSISNRLGAATTNTTRFFEIQCIYRVQKLGTPTIILFSYNSGNSGKVYDSTTSADVAASVSTTSSTGFTPSNQSGGTIAAGDRIAMQYTADARL